MGVSDALIASRTRGGLRLRPITSMLIMEADLGFCSGRKSMAMGPTRVTMRQSLSLLPMMAAICSSTTQIP